MPDYRLYIYHPSGRVKDVRPLDCPDDAEAIVAAERERGDTAMELWQRDRKVRRFEPPPEA